jgi:hypothetical protein
MPIRNVAIEISGRTTRYVHFAANTEFVHGSDHRSIVTRWFDGTIAQRTMWRD